MLRKIQSSLLYAVGWLPARWHRTGGAGSAVVLMYHRVDPPTARPDLAVPGLYGVERGVPVDVFERQMHFMLRHFEPRPTTALWGAPGGRPGFAVTFDDGYADNLHLAAPVLERLRIPATIFLSTDFVGTDRRFWWESLGAMVRETAAERLDAASVREAGLDPWTGPERLALGSAEEREQAHWHLSEALMRTPPDAMENVLRGLADALGVTPRFEGRDWPLLTWEQARALPGLGFEVGAHGANHLNLGLAAPDAVREEIRRSVADVAEHLDRPVRAFAYPYGAPEHRGDVAVAAVREAGCEVAFTTDLGVATTDDDRWLLPRAGLTRGDAFASAYQIDEAFRAARGRSATHA
jgi:peptidoglycan/xylan/chitin deacetylase (PgdA/CDA1 family)